MVAINWLGPKGSKGKPTSGTWNTTTNWDAGKVPGRSDDVNLGGNSAYTVTLDTTGNAAASGERSNFRPVWAEKWHF